jgi:hypothetical protein
MPIKGITDRNRVRIPTIGHLRKGSEKANGKFGKDLDDHFRFDSDDPALVERFYELYGDKPNYIRVALPYPEVRQNFDPYLEEWRSTSQGGLLIRRCDGEQQVKHLIDKSNPPAYSYEPKPCARNGDGGCACKNTTRLGVFVSELEVFGLVVVHSTSLYDALRLDEQLNALYLVRSDLSYMPLELYRTLEEVTTTDGQGKKRKAEKGILNVRLQPGQATRWVFNERQRSNAAHAAQPVVNEDTGEILDGASYDGPEEDENEREHIADQEAGEDEREDLITVLCERKRVKRDAFDNVPTEKLREMVGGQGVDFQKLRERKQARNEPVAVGAGDDDLNPPF